MKSKDMIIDVEAIKVQNNHIKWKRIILDIIFSVLFFVAMVGSVMGFWWTVFHMR